MQTRTCTASNQSFTIRNQDVQFYETMGVPLPTLCPTERMRRRLAWRNERSLHHHTCHGSGKKIISMYRPDSGHLVYDNEYWWGDNWDGQTWGRDFDLKRNFLEQWHELFKAVPKMARVQQGDNLNSRYTNCASYNKNCYLLFTANNCEDCMYSTWLNNCQDCLDCYAVFNSELMYQCIECSGSYNVQYSQQIDNSNDVYHSYDCKNCENLFACVSLRSQKYQILNNPVSPEEFQSVLESPEKQANVLKQLQAIYLNTPKKYADILMCENCTGDNVFGCKNCHQSYLLVNCEDCAYSDGIFDAKNTYDVSYYGGSGTNELLYECEGVGHGVFNSKFCKLCWGGCQHLEYCYECFNCQDCFGCVGLKKAQYCILNTQYSAEDYHRLRAQIIEHMQREQTWGEFFPISLSPFGYNETTAQDYFPLTKEDAIKHGFPWYDDTPASKYVGAPYAVPTKITDTPDSICDQILQCQSTGKNYKIQPAELDFYRQMKLPVPTHGPDTRHAARMRLRRPRQLWERTCVQCPTKIITPFAPERPEKVLCEECYLRAVN